jgi:hypothetical protein
MKAVHSMIFFGDLMNGSGLNSILTSFWRVSLAVRANPQNCVNHSPLGLDQMPLKNTPIFTRGRLQLRYNSEAHYLKI